MKESFLAHHVRVTQAAFNMEEMLLGVFIDLTQREFIFAPMRCKPLKVEESMLGGITLQNFFANRRETSGCEATRLSPTMMRLISADITWICFMQSLEKDMIPVRTKLINLKRLHRFHKRLTRTLIFEMKLSFG